jgi:hypothetical protein
MATLAEVERRLRLRIPPALWREAEREGLVGELEIAANDKEEREALANLRRFFTRRMEPKAKSDSVYSTTALARAFVAMQARAVSELLPSLEVGDILYPLRALREQHLQGEFVPVEKIPDWLEQHQYDGNLLPATRRLWLYPETESRVLDAILAGQSVTLEPNEVWITEQPLVRLFYKGKPYSVLHDGALFNLFHAVYGLMDICGWREDDAIEFALANRVPDGLPTMVRVEWNLIWSLSFVSLRVPLYIQPEEVGKLYSQVRREHLKGRKRCKGIEPFTARFVRFVEVYRLEHPRAKWKEIIAEWNRQHPNEAISEKRAQNLITHYKRIRRIIAEQVEIGAQGDY